MGRSPCCEKVGLKKGRWTSEEDEILIKYIQENGEGCWRSLPKNAGLLRCGKSCRLRWINYLRADLKRGNITAEEEDIIIKLHASFGNRWSFIASHMPGRTDNEIKNYWNSHLSREIETFRRPITTTSSGGSSMEQARPMTIDMTKEIAPSIPKRKGGRTSRWAMKKNKAYTTKKENQNSSKNFGNISAGVITTRAKDVINLSLPSDNYDQMNNIMEAIPLPATPALEKQSFPSVIGEDSINSMLLGTNHSEESKDQTVSLGPNREEEKGKENSIVVPYPPKSDEKGTEISGPYDTGGIEGEVLCLNDKVVDYTLPEASGVPSIGEGGGGQHYLGCVTVGNKDMNINNSSSTCSNNKSEDPSLNSCSSSMICDEVNYWELESDKSPFNFMQRREGYSSNNIDKETLLSWLWDTDNWESDFHEQKLGIDCEKQNAMVAWLLSEDF